MLDSIAHGLWITIAAIFGLAIIFIGLIAFAVPNEFKAFAKAVWSLVKSICRLVRTFVRANVKHFTGNYTKKELLDNLAFCQNKRDFDGVMYWQEKLNRLYPKENNDAS